MNFDFITTLDVRLAAAELANIDAPQWDAFTLRQSIPGTAHGDTKCIPLRGALAFTDSFIVDAPRSLYAYAADYPHTCALVNEALRHLNVAAVGNVLAVALMPGGLVTPHQDEGEYAEHFERFHIVLTSETGNWFQVGNDIAYPQPGGLFFFNHREVHSVGNPTKEARIHLIVDVTLKD